MEQPDSPDSAYIALAIKSLRKEKKLSQRRLSWAADISEETIYLLEYRKTNARLDTLQRIAKALDTTLDGLIIKGKELFSEDAISLREVLCGNIKAARQHRCLTQQDLAFKAKIGIAYVSKIERNLISVSVDKVSQIAHALNVSPDLLFRPDFISKLMNDPD